MRTADPQTLLTPAMRSVISRMARAGLPPLHTLPPAQARQVACYRPFIR